MKYLFFSFYGEGLPIAWHLQNEGFEVTVGMAEDINLTRSRIESPTTENPITKRNRMRLYDGLLNKMSANDLLAKMKNIPDPQNYFVFFEMNLLFKYAEQVQHLGFHGNFPTEDDYILEIDRQAAKNFVKQHYPDLLLPEAKSFTKISEAQEFLHASNEFWIVKGFDPNAHVFIPDAPLARLANNQVATELEYYQEEYERSGFLLERYIRNLIEYLPQRIYYDGKLLGVTVDIENKPFGSGNISYQTGCAADLVFPVSFSSKINQIAFPPIVDELAKKHMGLFFWDASILIDKDTNKIYFGEYCANRPGYNEFFTQLTPLPSVHHFFDSIVAQKEPYTLGDMAASTRIFNINRDDEDKYLLYDVPIDILADSKKNFWPFDVYMKDNRMYISGSDFNVGVVTGTGKTIYESCQDLSKNLPLFSYGDKYYRPLSDFLSRGYPSAILNRLAYGLEHDLFSLPQATLGTILDDIPEHIV